MTWGIWALNVIRGGSEQGCWGDMRMELGKAYFGQAASVVSLAFSPAQRQAQPFLVASR